MQFKAILAGAALLAASTLAHAGVIVGGSSLLNNASQTQLETWLGKGPLTLTNIYDKNNGDYAYNFHNAVDGKGATFTVMSVTVNSGQTWETIGGYNPNSWSSNSGWSYSNNQADWKGFIFNLTDSVKWSQYNGYQAYSYTNYGPSFGGGFDLHVGYDMNWGYSHGYSYGSYGSSLVSQLNGSQSFQVRDLEVFSIAPGSVPEPGSMALMGLGLLGLAFAARRKQ